MIHWLLQPASECPEIAHGAAPSGLLNAAEVERMEQLTSVKRRSEWLLGRCAAKRLTQHYVQQATGQQPPLDALVVARESDENAAPIIVFDCQAVPMDLPAGARWISAAPLVAAPGRRRGQSVPRVSGMRLPISLSISHSSELALCALYAPDSDWPATAGQPIGPRPHWRDAVVDDGFPADGLVQVGVDIESIEPRSDSFEQAYFAADEMHWIGQALDDEQALLATITWSAKEAVLKALRLGLTVDTRRVVCLPATGLELTLDAQNGWSAVQVMCDPALLPEALRQAGCLDVPLGRNGTPCDWDMRGWWRREGRFVLTLAALHVAMSE